MIRRALASVLAASGLSGSAGAGVGVDADDRAVEADRVAGRAQVLAAQRAALGGRRGQGRADAAGRIAARVARAPVLAVVDEVEARAVAAARVERAVGAERERRRSSGSGYCWHQSSTSTCSAPVITLPAACSRESRPLTTQPSSSRRAASGSASEVAPAVPQRGAVPPIAAS